MNTKKALRTGLVGVAFAALGAGCAPASNSSFTVKQTGGASFYEDRSVLAFPKYRNARGCAHKTLPAGTTVRLRYKGKYTSCVVDDRGPYVSGRIIDLQAKQFAELAPLSAGVISGVEISY